MNNPDDDGGPDALHTQPRRPVQGGEAREITSTIVESSSALVALSRKMSENAERNASQAEKASQLGEEVSTNVVSVASAVEEMSSTIREISAAVNDSSKVAQRAVSVSQDAATVIAKLHKNSEQIDQIIRTITTIAGQTNILALNATIEAARAGEAGKGFAVVANAVKELSRETAAATKVISTRLEEIREQAMEAVSSIEEINQTLVEVERSSNTIAVAVEEQSSATNEISRNMSEAAVGVNQVVEIVLGVAAAAGDNSSKLAQARKSAENMGSLAERLGTILRG